MIIIDPNLSVVDVASLGNCPVSSGMQPMLDFHQGTSKSINVASTAGEQDPVHEYLAEPMSHAQLNSTDMSSSTSPISSHKWSSPSPRNTSSPHADVAQPEPVQAKAKRRRKKNIRTAAEVEANKIENLARNREAAARCREKKKKNTAAQLARSKQDIRKNALLTAERDYLVDVVKTLKATWLVHKESPLECQLVKQDSEVNSEKNCIIVTNRPTSSKPLLKPPSHCTMVLARPRQSALRRIAT